MQDVKVLGQLSISIRPVLRKETAISSQVRCAGSTISNWESSHDDPREVVAAGRIRDDARLRCIDNPGRAEEDNERKSIVCFSSGIHELGVSFRERARILQRSHETNTSLLFAGSEILPSRSSARPCWTLPDHVAPSRLKVKPLRRPPCAKVSPALHMASVQHGLADDVES
jgi:hypothetical protein